MPVKKSKLQTPRGMRDFLPEEMSKRQFIIDTIRDVFESYGFLPFESPAIEHWEVLSAKCGQETENQIYQFRDKGDRLVGLRFDLTVPITRVMSTITSIPLPFKRYHIGRAWRYERPQAGRYREFWQADIDIFGVTDNIADVELLAAAVTALTRLGFKDFKIRINNRKILAALIVKLGIAEDKILDVFRSIDKLDKIGLSGVKQELRERDIDKEIIPKIIDLISIKGGREVLDEAKKNLSQIPLGLEGITDLEEIINQASLLKISKRILIDFSLVRGLDYYTGSIYEVRSKDVEHLGSLAGGGRYDNLVEILGGPKTPATGISLGIERIAEAMEIKNLFKSIPTKIKVYVAPTEDRTRRKAFQITETLRRNGIATEYALLHRRLKRLFKYVNSKKIPLLIIVGPKDLEKNKVTVRLMEEKTQTSVGIDKLLTKIKAILKH